MDNKNIIKLLKKAVSLMELHDVNTFKVKGYNNAIFNLERFGQPLSNLSLKELEDIQGVGKSIAKGIDEINQTGLLQELEQLIEKTPKGLIKLLGIKGIGAKKIRTVWQTLGIEDDTALLKAAHNGELAKLKGFGAKTQDNIKEVLLFKIANKGKLHYSVAEKIALELETQLKASFPDHLISITGDVRRKMEIIDEVKFLVGTLKNDQVIDFLNNIEHITYQEKISGPYTWRGIHNETETMISVRFCEKASFYNSLIFSTGSNLHLSHEVKEGQTLRDIINKHNIGSEQEGYQLADLPLIAPEMREGLFEFDMVKEGELPDLIEMKDLKGILHNHSTYSDGLHSLEEMATHCMDKGYEYLGISDHSKSAFYYANGLKEEKVMEQHEEIDTLNKKLAPFKIFKGIESDILADGSLDYDNEVLASFDFIVASIHSGLSMDVKKATERLITAISNPFTTMLGHPTGRLLLQRKGYPVDHKAIIDACAEYDVIIEINSHPYRLDLDWRWVNYAIQKNVMLSLNPDAHEKDGYDDMYYGLCVGRKGGLTKSMNFNSLSRAEVAAHFKERKERALAAI